MFCRSSHVLSSGIIVNETQSHISAVEGQSIESMDGASSVSGDNEAASYSSP